MLHASSSMTPKTKKNTGFGPPTNLQVKKKRRKLEIHRPPKFFTMFAPGTVLVRRKISSFPLGDVKPLFKFNCQGVSAGKLRRWQRLFQLDDGEPQIITTWKNAWVKSPNLTSIHPKRVVEFQVLFKLVATCSRFEGWLLFVTSYVVGWLLT